MLVAYSGWRVMKKDQENVFTMSLVICTAILLIKQKIKRKLTRSEQIWTIIYIFLVGMGVVQCDEANTTPLRIKAVTNIPTEKPFPTKNTTLGPKYWSANRLWTRYEGLSKNFWARYANCFQYAFYPNCDQFRMANAILHPYVGTMLDPGDTINTNIEDRNPHKCMYNEFWSNITAHSAIYSFFWYKPGLIEEFTLKVNNFYRTMTIGTQLEPEFSCSLGMNASFVRTYIGLLIAQNWNPLGMWYNETTKGFDEQNYEYEYDEYDSDSDSDGDSDSHNISTPTTTTDTVTPSINSTTTVTPSTTTPRWDTWENQIFSKPRPIKYGLPPLPKPWGNRCPNSLWRYIENHKLPVPNNVTSNWLCAAGFPNLPFYGNFTILHNSKIGVTTNQQWKWDDWMDILKLGVEHWRWPIILTDLAPQPWHTSRDIRTSKSDCEDYTHTCYITQTDYDGKGHTYNNEQNLIYNCIAPNVEVAKILTLKLNSSEVNKCATNMATVYLNNTNRYHEISSMKQSAVLLQKDTCKISGVAKLRQGKVIPLWFYNNEKLYFDKIINTTMNGTRWEAAKSTDIYNGIDYTIYKFERIWKDVDAWHKNTFHSNKRLGKFVIHLPYKPRHSLGIGNTVEYICSFAHAQIDAPIPYDIDIEIGNVTIHLIKPHNNKSEPNPNRCITEHAAQIMQKPVNMTGCLNYTHPGITRITYRSPNITITAPVKKGEQVNEKNYKVHYAIGEKTGEFLKTLNMKIKGAVEIQHTGLPYYFQMLSVNPQYQEWNMAEWIAHKPKGNAKSYMANWDKIYYLPMSRSREYLSEHTNTPLIIYRGNFTKGSETFGLMTAHFPKGYLIPPPGNPRVVKAPGLIPDLKTAASLILHPKLRKVEIKMDITALKPPAPYCGTSFNMEPLQYTSPAAIGRKPLQLLAVGAFMAGAIVGGIMGGGIAAAIVEPLKAEIYHIQDLGKKQAEAISVISNAMDGIRVMTSQMQTEILMIHDMQRNYTKALRALVNTNHAQLMCNMYTTQADKIEQELNTLFTTGLGRRTKTYQTLLDPTETSECGDGLCTLHLIQIYTDTALPAYKTISIPQPIEVRTKHMDHEGESAFVIPINQYLWANLNGTPVYAPITQTIQLGANTYVYPHIPTDPLETSPLAVTYIRDSLENTGDYTFLICTTYKANITCTNLNETTMDDDIHTFKVNTAGCYIMHNCSIANVIYESKLGNITSRIRSTDVTLEETHYWATESFTDPNILEHHKHFLEKIQEIDKIAEFNEPQLQAIHNSIKKQEKQIHRDTVELHNLAHVLRTNTYIHKDWAKQMKKCSFWDYLARLAKADLICTPLYSWWLWVKTIFYWLIVILVISTIWITRGLHIKPLYRCFAGRIAGFVRSNASRPGTH